MKAGVVPPYPWRPARNMCHDVICFHAVMLTQQALWSRHQPKLEACKIMQYLVPTASPE